MWKSQSSYTKPERIAEFIRINSLDEVETKEKIKNINEQEGDIEENSGVDFPGMQFDTFLSKTYKEVDKTSNSIYFNYDLIVVETAALDGKFMFRFNKNPGVYGKCENCYQTGILRSVCPCKKVAYCSDLCRTRDEKYHLANCEYENKIDFSKLIFTRAHNARRGVVGLSNLGNTCFMNSALQCLSNTWPLTKYFLEKRFENEINSDNPLGTKGELVFHYARLLNELWNKENDIFSPSQLKRIIGKHNQMVI